MAKRIEKLGNFHSSKGLDMTKPIFFRGILEQTTHSAEDSNGIRRSHTKNATARTTDRKSGTRVVMVFHPLLAPDVVENINKIKHAVMQVLSKNISAGFFANSPVRRNIPTTSN